MKERFRKLLYVTCQVKASDLHLTAGLPPALRINGELQVARDTPMQAEELLGIAKSILTEAQLHQFEEKGELDFSYELEDISRFRLNLFRQRGAVSLAVRVIPKTIPSLETMSLPPVLKELAAKPQGLILVTGPTGSGKSTTMAAIIDYINRTMRKHVITLEDPIEFVHQHKNCVVQQREVGQDTKSFANGLRAALRQDPDVILVGEMRDLETVSIALTAAETGHLVMGTLHTTSAPSTIDRIVDVFPGEEQNRVRLQLASVLVATISQRLFPRADGNGRIAATEILRNNPAVANLIRSGKIEQIPSIMLTNKDAGMHTLDTTIKSYVAQGIISREAASAYI